MKKLAAVLALLFCSVFAQATTVTGTVTDLDSQTWNAGTWQAQLVSPNGPPTVSGTPLTQAQQNLNGQLSAGGVLSATLTANATIDQANTSWTFILCPNASAPCVTVRGVTIVGSTQDISSTLSAGLKGPRFQAGPGAFGYLNVEVYPTPAPGAIYFNVASGYCNLSLTGWVCPTGSGGGVTSTTDNPQSYGTSSLGTQALSPLTVLQNNAVNASNVPRGPFYIACGSWPGLWDAAQPQAAGAYTSFVTCPLSGNTNFVKVCNTGSIGGTGGTETVIGNDLILQESLSYPAATTVQQFSFDGKTEWRMDRNAPLVCTDPLGFRAPSGTTTQAVLNTYVRVPTAPTFQVANPSVMIGGLAASTTYYYQATCVDYTGIESGKSTTQNQTTTTLFLSMTFNITPSGASLKADGTTTNCSAYGIYRGTVSTGPFNFLHYVAAVPTGNTRDYDLGLTALGSAVPPTAPNLFYNARRTASSNFATTFLPYNQVGTGPGTAYSGWTADTVLAPTFILSDDPTNRPWCAIGDSRLSEGDVAWGAGLTSTTGAGQFYGAGDLFGNYSWFTRGMTVAGKTSFNLGMPSARLDWLVTNTNRTSFRNTAAQFCYGVVSEMGVNDIDNAVTWQTVAQNKMQEAWGYKQRNIPYISTTIEPVTVDTTTNYRTLAAQTPINYTSVRTAFNDWIRAGGCVAGQTINISTAQITYGTPTAPTVSGASFTCPTGSSPTKLLAQTSASVPIFVDIACTVEVDINGNGCTTSTVVYDGGYWSPMPGTPVTGALQAATDVTHVQLASGSYTNMQYAGYSILMTSGAASGQFADIFISDTSANATLFANGVSWPGGGGSILGLTTVPAAGDTYVLVRIPTTDGLHGSTAWNRQVSGPYFAAWIAANIPNNW